MIGNREPWLEVLDFGVVFTVVCALFERNLYKEAPAVNEANRRQ